MEKMATDRKRWRSLVDGLCSQRANRHKKVISNICDFLDGVHQERDGEDGHKLTTVAFPGQWSMLPGSKQAKYVSEM